MKSIIKGIPKSYKVDLNTISEITAFDPAKSDAVEFKNKNGDILGRFNPLSMSNKQFESFLKVISERNKNIEIRN